MQQFDPSNVVLAFAGICTGFAKGTFIKAGRNEETWKLVVGADGTVARVRNRNVSGRVTLTLMQTSPTNAILAALVALDEQTGAGVTPLLMKDLGSVELVSSPEAWIIKPADKDYGDELSNREWIIEMGECIIV